MKQCRLFFAFVACCFFFPHTSSAQLNSEEVLLNRLLVSIQTANDSLLVDIFPRFDSMLNMVTAYVPESAEETERMKHLRTNPEALWQFDPAYSPAITDDFNAVVRKGRDSGIHWNDILVVRYELQKMRLPRELIGFEKIATTRLGGFIYVEDILTRRTYMIAVTDVLQIKGKWYGGHLINIQQASSEDEYNRKLAGEVALVKEMMEKGPEYVDSVKKAAEKHAAKLKAEREEDDEKKVRTTEVLERKYYVGKFDNEVEVEMYVRSLRGDCPDGICAWQAIYKFGDMEYFALLEVKRSPEGVFSFTEEDMGVMEVKLAGGRFTGTWTSFRNQTEYEVYLKEKPEIKNKKLLAFDTMLEEMLEPED